MARAADRKTLRDDLQKNKVGKIKHFQLFLMPFIAKIAIHTFI
jgi:hypothetical protein